MSTEIVQDTWGHLYPGELAYEGFVRLVATYYDGTVIIHESDTLPDASPWWHEAITEFAYQIGQEMEAGEVVQIPVRVDIVHCEEELEDWEVEELVNEGLKPKTWTEIKVSVNGDLFMLLDNSQQVLI